MKIMYKTMQADDNDPYVDRQLPTTRIPCDDDGHHWLVLRPCAGSEIEILHVHGKEEREKTKFDCIHDDLCRVFADMLMYSKYPCYS